MMAKFSHVARRRSDSNKCRGSYFLLGFVWQALQTAAAF